MIRAPHFKRLCVIALSLAFAMPAALHGQGMFDAKPVRLPWRIAFVRDRNIWIMNADGSGQKAWRQFGNVISRLSWSPDGKQLAWARQGDFTYHLPDGGGGGRKLYDIFRAEVDSTRDGYWRWVTFDHGSRAPEFAPDGQRIVFTHDLNANTVDAELPDFQIEYCNLDGTNPVRLTRKGAKPGECQGMDPTWSPDATQIAFIYHKRAANIGEGGGKSPSTPIGLVVAPSSGITMSDAELEAAARKVPYAGYPSWSPDGKWIAYVNTNSSDGGIYLTTPDGTAQKRLFEKIDKITPIQSAVSWSPDSKWLTFASTDGYIYIIDSKGEQKPQRITSAGNDYLPSFSPK